MNTGHTQKTLLLRFCLLFLPVAAAILLAALYLDDTQANNRQQALMEKEQLRIAQQVQTIHATFDAIIADLVILSKHNDFNHIPVVTPATRAAHLQELAAEFKQFHIYKPHYDQIRFINATGMETIRTNSNDREVNIVAKDRLQYKGHRAYFTEAMKLDHKQVYISSMDLNLEHHQIQIPFKPVIRFSIPLFGSENNKFGTLTLNYRAEFLLQALHPDSSINHVSRIMLLNMDGYWLKHNDPSMTWGFMLPDRSAKLFSRSYPDTWEKINASFSGQEIHAGGLFTFTKVHPFTSIKNRLNSNIPSELIYQAVPEHYSWTLVSHIPADKLAVITRASANLYIIITTLLLVWASIALVLAREQQARQHKHILLEEKEAEIRNIVDSAFNGIITISERGIIETFNPAACKMFGIEASEAVGQNVSIIAAPPHAAAHDSYLQHYNSGGEARIINRPREVMGQHKDGSTFPVELFVTESTKNGHKHFIGTLHNITERKQMERRLKTLAVMDGLTGVHNRAYFNAKLAKEFKRAKRYKKPLSLLLLDVDHFKSVNDRHGHPAGDAMLIAIANRARASARETDIVARYGGEEFVIILPETDGKAALLLAERLRASIESLQVEYAGQIISRTVSIGIACLQDFELGDEDDLLSRADQALYQAKEDGRNRVILHESQ